MKEKSRFWYGFLAVFVLFLTTVGATYAYWTASTESFSNDISTSSTIFSISMSLNPLYHDFSIIPMNDEDAVKGLKNKCRDKYDRGVCSAYTIYVYDYNANLDYISGFMNVSTNNMENLRYMVLRLSDVYDEDNCVNLDTSEEIYCVVRDAEAVLPNINLSLGDSYSVKNMESTKFILLMWLRNLNYGQNDIDIGSFNAIVTIQAGNGGEIKGSISSAIRIGEETGDGKNE